MEPVKPPPLEPGDRIALIAPASAPRDAAVLEAGVAHLEGLGYEVVRRRPAFPANGYLAGTDEERLDELNHFLGRGDVSALFCARGGYGTLRLLPHVDYAAARRHPKLLVGYSDITALHLALYHRAGLPGLSGPMVAVEWGEPDAESERLFWELARGGCPDPFRSPGGGALRTIRPGSAEGVLLGGNLTLVARLLGTPYLPPLDGALLFLEEIGEEPYRLDGLLAHLRLAGVLDRIGGLLLGGFTEWTPEHDRPTLHLDDVLDHYTRGLAVPVVRDLAYGHFPIKNTLPIGVRARLVAEPGEAALHLLEPVTVPGR